MNETILEIAAVYMLILTICTFTGYIISLAVISIKKINKF